MSPFEIVFGSNSTNALVLVPIKKPDKLVVTWMEWPREIKAIHEEVRKRLEASNRKCKAFVDCSG